MTCCTSEIARTSDRMNLLLLASTLIPQTGG
jgi:hypothetical protein